VVAKRNKNNPPHAAPVSVLPVKKPVAASAVAGFAAWGFTALMLLGYIAFRTEGTLARGNKMSVDRALFTVVNASTLTGFQLNLAIDHYNPRGQWMMLILTIGGTQFALVAGGIAVSRIARLPYRDEQIALVAVGAQIVVIGLGFLTLSQPDQPAVATMIQACSAFGNSGVWMGRFPQILDRQTHVVLLPLAFLGGLGIPVLMDLFDAARRKRPLSNHTLAVLQLSALVYLVGVALCFVLRWPADTTAAMSVLASSSEAAINTRTAGLPIEFAADFPRYLQWVLIALMMIGPAPGGAGSGLKVTTIGKLFSGIRDVFAGRNPGRLFGIAIVWLTGLLLLVFVSFLLLLWTDPGLDADRLFFIATSAAANVGLAHDRVGIVGNGMYVLTLTMLLGRILPVGVLWWALKHADETDVAVG
jgi:trk system potassium uptake protein TrkH